ncbi:hypothetical protein [Alkalibacillus aidingensis]|uniref:hypothetical protein n=1 Tax=Alkalibacillus aidingensis TaxID=2747607 RepID=UPI00166085C9|nr:hypothetical protein [Alkalibacillus aidingensis]
MDHIEVVNLAPKFLEFYQRANREGVDCEERWELWQKHYNFAAVPPGDEGKKMARKILDENWVKYRENIDYIKDWQPDSNAIEQYLSEIKSLLGYEQPINMMIIYFVGGFENNPFVAPYDEGRIALCLPIESEISSITLYHEITHIVHLKTANLTQAWERTIASTIIQEGLATQVSKYMVPGKPDQDYIEHKEGWLDSCQLKRKEILEGILPYLKDSSSETIIKFTFGAGSTNTDREVYFAGWEIVRVLLEHGETFLKIAWIQEEDIPNYIRNIYQNLFN